MSIETKKLFEIFEVIGSESDRNGAFKDLTKNPSSLMLVTDDDLIFTFKFIRIESKYLFMTPVEEPRKITASETVFMIFSISSGQYAMKGPVKYAANGDVAFELHTELRRLQRRKNFRVNSEKVTTLKLNIMGIGEKKKPIDLKVTDISAGGISVLVPGALIANFKIGQEIECNIIFPEKSVSDLNGVIRHIGPMGDAFRWGIEFKLSNEQMQSMLGLSLRIHRESLLIINS